MENIDFNWLAQTPSTVVPIESYTPDYSFLQSMQMKIGQQYQQGVSQVRGAYANIFNRPVTGEAANKTLQEYKRQAQEQLQSITGYNFADQKNVQLAEDVFKPFTEDKALLYNIAGTQTYNDNTQKIQSGLQSTDEKTRDMYNSIQLQDQEGYKKELAEAGLDRDKQSRIQQRSVTPFYDIPTELKNAAGKEGTDNEWDVLDGAGHIIKQKGGAQSLGNYSTFARSALSNPKYQGMFETMARVRRDQLIDQVKATDKTVTPDNVNQKVADYVIDENNKVYDKVITDYNGDISKLTNELNLIKGRIKTKNVNGEHAPTDAAYDTFMQYQTTINKLNGELHCKETESCKGNA